jgi:hypothetical protein
MNESPDPQQIRACPGCGNVQFKIKYIEPPFKVVQCRDCALVYLGNPPDERAIYEDYYEGSAYSAAEYDGNSKVVQLAELFAIN